MDALRPQDPARIGAYQLLARLGAGGMGQVYLGRSPGGRLVAVKVIRDEISDHPDALARFRREAATVETVRSAYTAQLIEASLDTSPYWLATEYVAGPTLRGAVGASGPFPPDSALRLLAALAEGLAAVHVHGVTHRDLKPHNVILSPQGPQLIDFGIARGLEQSVLTRDGMVSGTPGYAAPEVLLRNEVGPAADVFALGATLAYTATGRPPYGTGDAASVSYRTVYEEIDLAGVRTDLAALIRMCVDKDPAERPKPAAVIALCGVDSPLASDAHYHALVRAAEPVLVPGDSNTPLMPSGSHAEPESVLAVTRRAGSEPADQPVERPATDVPAQPSGSTPYAAPDQQRRPRRGRTWAALCAVALAVPVTVWLLPETDGKGTDAAPGPGATTSGRPAASRSATADRTARPPDHIVNDRVSKDRWKSDRSKNAALGGGRCDPDHFPESFPPSGLISSVSHTTGSGTASVSLRFEDAGEGKRPAPYYVSVGVRPPHETDRATGRPLRSEAKGIGFTSKPVDIYSHWSSGGAVELTYPDAFRAHFSEKTLDAIPVGDDRGDWTVVIYHVEGGPTKYTSVSCNGFHA
ncbi:protein kinase [Streptomyces sp. NBC_01260]|uniref:serine/threonine-protein kinase n=1 Tax=unclassified Streptomyces TaxID=2593676 RepID=UPI000F484B06|nr:MULTISPECIES: serine/threonine-protein kinase [unclassified Streptomyces]MCX4774575.1 protein kinase [Streptomyces sp. NBC_01285]